MPIHLGPLSRRRFLAAGSAAATLALMQPSPGGEAAGSDVFALLADTHIPEHPDVVARGVNMTENFRHIIADLCAMDQHPAGVIVNGDCAYLKGLPADYVNFAACIQPLTAIGLPLHLTMGNHDDRQPFYDALSAQRPQAPPVESKHLSIIETQHANLFLLDSLREVDVVTGELGRAQLAWLARSLDARQDKPAVIVAHHNPQFQPPEDGSRWTGLEDSEALFELLAKKQQVKAYIYGHTHHWATSQRDGIHLINLPPVAYVFDDSRPNGWVRAKLRDGGMELELRAMNPMHKQHGQRVELDWR